MGPGDPGGPGPGHKPALRSPKSPANADIDWQKIHHQFFDDPKSMDTELSEYLCFSVIVTILVEPRGLIE